MTSRHTQPRSHVPPELQEEFEAQTHALLRERFLWFSGILTGLALFLLILEVVFRFAAPSLLWFVAKVPPDKEETGELWPTALAFLVGALGVTTYGTCFFVARTKVLPRHRFLQLTYLLVVCDGLLRTCADFLPGGDGLSLGVAGIAFTHFLACCFLPWTFRQALQPLLPVFGLWALLNLTVGSGTFLTKLFETAWSVVLFAPALGIVLWMSSRRADAFERQFLYRRYRDVRRELYDARRIHEALFPQPVQTGPVRVNYRYEPMQQIGGDYFFTFQPGPPRTPSTGSGQTGTFQAAPPTLSVVLLDVTGHGILAALTVNRIYGELSRIFAERPGVTPSEVLRDLNKYAHLTMAPHSVYVTAMCARVDVERNVLHYANGGHPPAYLRRADGTVEELIATTFLLGPCPDMEYDPGSVEVPMHAGDSLIAYTDGVIEARGHSGKEWGLAGIRNAVRNQCDQGSWAAKLVKQVEEHRLGPAADDTLVVEIWRPTRVSESENGKSGIFRATEATRRVLGGTGKFAAMPG